MGNIRIYLASESPRRHQLLEQLGIDFQPVRVNIDESPVGAESPYHYVERLSLAKARAGWQMVAHENAPVLGADTCVVIDNNILGKPRDKQHGLWMLEQLSGTTHQIYSGVAITKGTLQQVCVNTSQVSFRTLTTKERLDYWQTGEPCDKAGGYAIQGKAAAFITQLEGSYSAVMGLPLYETAQLLSEFGVDVI